MKNCFIDLHLHLDGSISLSSARQLAKIEGITLPSDDNALKTMLTVEKGCRNLNDYLERFALPVSLMQSEESIALAAFNLCEELRLKGFIYAELRFAPQKHCEKGLTQEQALGAAISGMQKSSLPTGLILCCMRDGTDNSPQNLETVSLAAKYLGKGVCAVDLAGAEALFPNEGYKYVFDKAKALAVPFTVHSGEALGAQSVAIALDCGASRIGHGIRSIEDMAVVKRLAESKVPIEVCPTSNINTCVYPGIADMPIPALIKNGVIVTINSDNMSVSDTDAINELAQVKQSFDMTDNDIKNLLLNSVTAAFANEDVKKRLRERIESEFG